MATHPTQARSDSDEDWQPPELQAGLKGSSGQPTPLLDLGPSWDQDDRERREEQSRRRPFHPSWAHDSRVKRGRETPWRTAGLTSLDHGSKERNARWKMSQKSTEAGSVPDLQFSLTLGEGMLKTRQKDRLRTPHQKPLSVYTPRSSGTPWTRWLLFLVVCCCTSNRVGAALLVFIAFIKD